ncbi:hypothetical protein R5H30_04920 [Sulfitobacter sp. D35]|uniref:hypothetical protein n=1 Tax=Sulfitobacter sp. D35 TaxID=3083252 RepID=UPI00296FFA55|nr:hypothetical protein [Sulfitobacter sp. D35]MDW4497314.1 hypothetical protein [Sulfitobacter sp. D35]
MPGPHFEGVEATRVTTKGAVFDVRVNGRLAEAVRVNTRYAPRFGPLADEAGLAMRQVSGCTVTEVRGDQAVATGLLDCGDGPPPASRLAPGGTYECVPLAGFPDDDLSGTYLDYECVPVG